MRLPRYAIYTWGVLLYNLAVILWGAYVRATGSGAGCGRHWPLCNGAVVPRSAPAETLTEFTHRLSSGLAFLLVVGLLIWAFRAYPKRHVVRRAAAFSMLFMTTEALVGAGLVLFQMVADNDSMARAFWIAAHLVNTFLLLASLTLTAWWASGGGTVRLRRQGVLGGILGLGLLGMLVLGVSGAVTALGDTLFPAGSLAEGLKQDFSPTAHLLIRLRLLHPVIAISVSVYLMLVAVVSSSSRSGGLIKALSQILTVLLFLQLAAGALNVALLAPVWLQLAHLFLADTIWVVLVLLAASALAQGATSVDMVSLPQP